MNKFTSVIKHDIWIVYYESFQNYCYNFFDENPENDFSNQQFDVLLKRIAIIPMALLVYYYSFNFKDLEFSKSVNENNISVQEQFTDMEDAYSIYQKEETFVVNNMNNKNHFRELQLLNFVLTPQPKENLSVSRNLFVTNCSLIV